MTSLIVRSCAFLVVTIGALAGCPGPRNIAEGEGEGEGELECLTATLGPVTLSYQDDVSTHYEAPITSGLDGAASDYLVLQFFNYNERIGDLGVGTFPLDDATNDNYGHCAECLLVFADQIGPNTAPARVFFQSEGTITTERNPREELDLYGAIEGLVLIESTIGGDALESAPVPGGDCLVIGDVELAVHAVPPEWTCAGEAYNAHDGVCDCDCGVIDPDCFPNFGDPPPTETTGCEAAQACTVFGCRDTCDAFAGTACPSGGDVCVFAEPTDFCEDGLVVGDPAQLGEACSDDPEDFAQMWCALAGTIPFGVCDYDLDGDGTRTCRARCTSAADCGPDEDCIGVAYADDGSARGYCDAPLE
jgi:hypothetical protein